jgi:hypothetical protein
MSDGQQTEQLAAQAAEAVRRVIADAEARADEIVREAEREAAGVRQRAEADARAQIDNAKRALDALTGGLEQAVGSGPTPGRPPAEAVPPHEPPPVPESKAEEVSAQSAEEIPAADLAPDQAAAGAAAGNGDDAAMRLLAMKMAIDGRGREQIAYELDAKFGVADRTALLDDVMSRAAG